MNLLYLIGQPGSGKSTLVQHLTAGLALDGYAQPFQRIEYQTSPRVVELGGRRNSFSGTDVLPLNVQPKVLAWLAEAGRGLVLGEGDRLANSKFFAGAAEIGYAIHVVWVATSHDVAERRRSARAAQLGVRPQAESWVAGRVTKNGNLAREWSAAPEPHRFTALDGDLTPQGILAGLLATGDPVATTLRSEV